MVFRVFSAAVVLLGSLELRGQTAAGYGAPAAVAHGSLHRETYTTKFVRGLAGDRGEFVVYTPPNYNPSQKPAYPVLYLLHGWGGNADAWVRRGGVDSVLDGMIVGGKVKPMVVVMPLGYGDMSFLTNGFEVWRDQDQISNNVDRFEQTLTQEIMPQVDKAYDVATDREHRAIAGLSMGGQESLTLGLRDANLFAWVGGFSSAMFSTPGLDVTKLDAKKEDLRLVWMSCGTDDDLLSVNRIFAMHLKEQGLPVTMVEMPGRHEWAVWRKSLRQFAPLLFRGDGTASR